MYVASSSSCLFTFSKIHFFQWNNFPFSLHITWIEYFRQAFRSLTLVILLITIFKNIFKYFSVFTTRYFVYLFFSNSIFPSNHSSGVSQNLLNLASVEIFINFPFLLLTHLKSNSFVIVTLFKIRVITNLYQLFV